MIKTNAKKNVFYFVLILGIANFFADATYEGARSILGPFLGSLGASATIIGFVAGFAEFIGYSFRAVTGIFADRTRQYWLFVFVGYAINLLAVPALALADNWPLAAVLIVAERTGRAIRRPSVEAMLSFTTKKLGHGWVFGFNEALDQAGATFGPLIVSLVIYLKGGYKEAFAYLLIPALLCLTTILIAWFFYRHPHQFEEENQETSQRISKKSYWLYLLGGCLIAAGFADFALISFHFQKQHIISTNIIPVLYSIAMATGAIASLVFGRLLDKFGFTIFLFAFFLSSFFAPFAFSNSMMLVIMGTVLWGLGLGTQESLLKAELSKVISSKERGSGFGIFDTVFGTGWFIGSALMGWLYDHSVITLMIFSVVSMLGAIPIFMLANKFVLHDLTKRPVES